LNQQRVHLYGSVFIASLGLGMYTYFIPVFAQTLGATFLDLGLIGTAGALAYAITPMLVAYLADRFNRAWLFTLGLAINILAALALIFSVSVRDVILSRLLGGFAYGIFWPSSEILVADLTPLDERVREMGWYSVAWASGFLLGPSIGGVVVQRSGFVWLFFASAMLIAFAIVPDLLWLVPGYQRKTAAPKDFSGSLSTIRILLPWYMISFCYGIILSVVVAIFPGYANSVGVVPEMIGLLFTAFGISRVFVYAASGRFVRVGEKKVLSFASGTLAAGMLAIATVPNFGTFFMALVVIGGGLGVIFPVTISLISRYFDDRRLGVAVGSYETLFGIGFAVGPLLAGIIAVLSNVILTFWVAALFGALMVLLIGLGPALSPPDSTESRIRESEFSES